MMIYIATPFQSLPVTKSPMCVCSKNSEYYFEMDKKDMHILVKNILVSEKKGKPKEKQLKTS